MLISTGGVSYRTQMILLNSSIIRFINFLFNKKLKYKKMDYKGYKNFMEKYEVTSLLKRLFFKLS